MYQEPKLKRYCCQCGEPFMARRKSAIYCSPACRVAAFRTAQNARAKPKVRSKKKQPTEVEIPELVTCIGCDTQMWLYKHNKQRLYCSSACKQRAYRARKDRGVNVWGMYHAHS
jgi:endogenous inhibitor of DNA gyrase (YacG/DUF329 family)